jgi:hypothetical protein
MNHNYIEQFDLIDRYLMGGLAAEESAQFEEHFIDCPECIDRLKTTKDFLQDLRLATVQQTSQTDIYRPRGLSRSVSQMLSPRSLALAAGCLLVFAIAGMILVINRMGSLQSDVDQAKSVSAQWERRYEEEQQSASLSDKKHQEVEQELTEQLRQLDAKLQNEQKQRTESGGGMRPGINLPIFVLNSVRGGGQNASEPVNEIDLVRSPLDFLMSVPLEGDTNYKDYRMTIQDNRNRTVWKRGGYKPNRYNSLSIGFNSRFFRPGNYLLVVEGVTKEGALIRVGNYPFRVSKNS